MCTKIMMSLLRAFLLLPLVDVAMSRPDRIGSTNSTASATHVSFNITPIAVRAVGPTKTEWLTMTLFGIGELKSEKEWSKLTAEYVADYFNSGGGNHVYEATVNISVIQQETVFGARSDLCGCPECTLDTWNRDACDDRYYCSTCGERITSWQGGGKNKKTQREACALIAGLEFEEECGSCNSLTCASKKTYCGCPQCTPEVWSRVACDALDFCSTCGERITFLYSMGNLERSACTRIGGVEFEDLCGACNPLVCNQPTSFCGCPKCTKDIWTKTACDKTGFCSTCGERIDFLQSLGRTERNACIRVAGKEHDDVCGECNPLVCNGETPDSPEIPSVSIVFSLTSTYKTSDPSMYDPFYVIEEPFSKEFSHVEYISYLQSQSNDYGDVVSVSPVTLSSPVVSNTSNGGIIVIIVVAGVCILAIIVREITRRDKFSSVPYGYRPQLYPVHPTDRLEDVESDRYDNRDDPHNFVKETDCSEDGDDPHPISPGETEILDGTKDVHSETSQSEFGFLGIRHPTFPVMPGETDVVLKALEQADVVKEPLGQTDILLESGEGIHENDSMVVLSNESQ